MPRSLMLRSLMPRSMNVVAKYVPPWIAMRAWLALTDWLLCYPSTSLMLLTISSTLCMRYNVTTLQPKTLDIAPPTLSSPT